jgi:hypothetical protein
VGQHARQYVTQHISLLFLSKQGLVSHETASLCLSVTPRHTEEEGDECKGLRVREDKTEQKGRKNKGEERKEGYRERKRKKAEKVRKGEGRKQKEDRRGGGKWRKDENDKRIICKEKRRKEERTGVERESCKRDFWEGCGRCEFKSACWLRF